MLAASAVLAAEPITLRIDFARTNGVVRPLHGVNKGPLASGGLIDITDRQRELAIPFTRLHDCQWPYPEVVDIHSIFRDPTADPEKPQSYDWALTDNYLAAVRQTGAQIIYRLGESIEHGQVKRFVHPPADAERWAAVCLGIIRHYNEGWAKGTRYGIQYWEIWNEPENRPAMWSGSDEDYISLYRTAARAIKSRFPQLKVGGPALGYSGRFEARRFVASEFATNFLASCRRESLPLGFFSWHCYTTDPGELVARSRAIRQLLDAYGLTKTESHLNEWNYLPGNNWDAFSKSASPELRQRFYEQMAGTAGAAFVGTALSELQDTPVDVCNFYHGELGGFGLFNEYGAPNQVSYVMRAFSKLAAMRVRAQVEGGTSGKLATLAARQQDGKRAAVLISNFQSAGSAFVLELSGLSGGMVYHVSASDASGRWREITRGTLRAARERIPLELSAPGVALVEIGER
jgi:xylan 1,4-beta-xylosidase